MPYSDSVFDQEVEDFIRTTKPAAVLDIGCGAGKYHDIVRRAAPDAKITGVEVDPGYVIEFKLRERYDTLRQMNAMNLLRDPDGSWDIAIFGDSIEHLRKSSGVDLLHFLRYRTRFILVVTPEAYLQNKWFGHIHEAHISSWAPHDFTGWGGRYHYRDKTHFWILEGFL